MDLPTCPACGQSVLDDDAQECPFCGSSMKPGSAPSPKAAPAGSAAKPAAAQKAPAGSASSKSPAPGASAEKPLAPFKKPDKPAAGKPDDDDPFAVDKNAGGKVIAVSPSPTKGRTVEVVCPMCETHGYISPRAAGQEVKCCNPECLVPTFTAPAAEKKAEPPPPPPPKKSSALMWGIMAAVVVAGVGVYAFVGGFGGADPNPKVVIDSGMYVPKAGGTTTDPDPINAASTATTPPDTPAVAAVTDVPPATASSASLTSAAFVTLVDAARKANINRKAFCRRLAAIEYAHTGDLAAAREQIDRLKQVAGQSHHERLLPLVAIAWEQLANPAEAEATLTEARSLVADLPSYGRYQLQAKVALAAVLTAAGKVEDAHQILASHRSASDHSGDALTAALHIVNSDRTFNLDTTLTGRSLDEWQAPLEVAVTLNVTARGRWDEALAWARKASDPAVAAECTLVWAEAAAAHSVATGQPEQLSKATEVAAGLSPAANARFMARVAAHQIGFNNSAAAEEWLTKAQAILAGLKPPAPIRINGMKELMRFNLPDSGPLRMAALAQAEVGSVRARLGQSEAAWADFARSLAWLRGMTPSPSLIGSLLHDLDTNSAEVTRQQMKAALDLRTDDEARRSLTKYRQLCTQFSRASTSRFQLQTELLTAALDQGLLDEVGNEVQTVSAKPDLNDQEPYAQSPLAARVLAQYAAAGKSEAEATLSAILKDKGEVTDPLPALRESTAAQVEAGEIDQAAEELESGMQPQVKAALQEWSLRLACRLVNAGNHQGALRWLSRLSDELLREDGLKLIAARAALNGHAEQFVAAAAGRTLSPTESAALNAGLIDGLARRLPPSPAPVTPPESAPAPAKPGAGAQAPEKAAPR